MDNNYNQGNNQQNSQNQSYNQNSNYNYSQNGYTPNNMNQMGSNGQGPAIASMVCGILSIVFCWCYGVVGLVLGIVALAMYNVSKTQSGGVANNMAKAGLVCGIIGAVLSSIYLVLWIIGCAMGSMDSLFWYRYF